MKKTYHHSGKLLLTGEYVVLDGALSLALPTKKGQRLEVTPIDNDKIIWKSYTHQGQIWFEAELFTNNCTSEVQQTLEQILQAVKKINSNFPLHQGFLVETFLDFPENWGLGSSSTLICNIAQWANINPYDLLFETFGGSGYDIACGNASTPILYQLVEKNPKVIPVLFHPNFVDELFFIHLNKKQNSREGITRYRSIKNKVKEKNIKQITHITEQFLQTSSKEEFCELIIQHEAIISKCIGLPTVKELLFPDFQGYMKSLGAWGGDFILAVGNEQYLSNYFQEKGYNTIIPFANMVV